MPTVGAAQASAANLEHAGRFALTLAGIIYFGQALFGAAGIDGDSPAPVVLGTRRS